MALFALLFFRFTRALRLALKNPDFRALAVVVLLLIGAGMLFYHHIEGWSFIDSYYFTVVTLTTVGYGDLTPATDLGKLFTTLYLFVGIGVLLAFISAIAQEVQTTRKEER
jgi:voltage-gated potassium channel